MSNPVARVGARLLVLPIVLSVLLSTPAPQAHADKEFEPFRSSVSTDKAAEKKHRERLREKRRKRRAAAVGERAIAAARSRAGDPYVYGAAGPHSFDCSGLTQWSFRRAGKYLPRTSGAQAGATQRVARPRRGDLVFFSNGGRVYHVGIYAGDHRLWHAPRPGQGVRLERIWTSAFYGRVR